MKPYGCDVTMVDEEAENTREKSVDGRVSLRRHASYGSFSTACTLQSLVGIEELKESVEIEREKNAVLMQELERAQIDAERMDAAIAHRDGVIGELAASRSVMNEEYANRMENVQAEMRQLYQTVQLLTRELNQERKQRADNVKALKRALRRAACGGGGGGAGAEEEGLPCCVVVDAASGGGGGGEVVVVVQPNDAAGLGCGHPPSPPDSLEGVVGF